MTEEENDPGFTVHPLPPEVGAALFAALTGSAPEEGTERMAHAFRDDARTEIASLWQNVAAHVDDAYPKWMRQQMLNASFLSSLPDTVEALMEEAHTLGRVEENEAMEPRLVRAEQKVEALAEGVAALGDDLRRVTNERDQLRQALEAAQHAAGAVGMVDPVTRGVSEDAEDAADPPRSGALLD